MQSRAWPQRRRLAHYPERATKWNATVNDVWQDIAASCAASNLFKPSAWRGKCLPAERGALFQKVCGAINERAKTRLLGRKNLLVDLACPHLFAFDPESNRWRWQNVVLAGRNGEDRIGTDSITVEHFDGRVLIAELEPETSFIDSVRVYAVQPSGDEVELQSTLPSLIADDGDFAILDNGDRMLIEFPQSWPDDAGRFRIAVRGYYLREAREPVQRIRRRRTP